MTFMELTKKRFSVKKFADKPLEEEKLQQILTAGNLAPTARNAQPQRIYVIRSKEAMEKAREVTPCIYGAPVMLLIAYNKDETYPYADPEEGLNSGDQDCSIVATHIMLEAADLGVGSCWVNKLSPAKAKEVFDLPANEYVVLMMCLGYAAEGVKPLPKHTQKKPLEDTIIEL